VPVARSAATRARTAASRALAARRIMLVLKKTAMEIVRFGSTGMKVSRLCLGAMSYGVKTWRGWVLEEAEARPVIKHAIEKGIFFFDCADMYSNGVSEEIMGRALKDFGPGRDRIVLATKVYMPMSKDPNDRGLSRKHILKSIDNSLRRLGTDYVDLYQIHRFDYETPVEETLEALNDCVRAGKVRYIGATAMFAWQFMKMLKTSEALRVARFVSMQCYHNLLYRENEREVIPMCRAEGIAVMPYSPLARGFVAGNRFKQGGGETLRSKTDPYSDADYYHPQDFAIVDRITEVARKRGVKNAQIAMAWMLQQPGITAPILGATKAEYIDDAIEAMKIKLEPEEIKALEECYHPRAILGHV
jgi:aryl-alcohol dehydrogenase-like predicted oxidoreductase